MEREKGGVPGSCHPGPHRSRRRGGVQRAPSFTVRQRANLHRPPESRDSNGENKRDGARLQSGWPGHPGDERQLARMRQGDVTL